MRVGQQQGLLWRELREVAQHLAVRVHAQQVAAREGGARAEELQVLRGPVKAELAVGNLARQRFWQAALASVQALAFPGRALAQRMGQAVL